MDEAIRQQIEANEIGAIALDTTIFDRHKGRLEAGLLRRLEQFRDYAFKILLVDVIQDELERHLAEAVREAQTELKGALLNVVAQCAVSPADHARILTLANSNATPADVAAQRVASWIERSQTERVIATEYVDLPTVMLRYFAALPPFAAHGTKKHEFPDALALLAIESWAEQRQTGVLVVSEDDDWKRYCAQSTRLVLIADLAQALGAFQQPTARYACRRVAELLGQGDPVGLASALEAALQAQDDRVWFDVEASSTYHVEHDVSEPEFLSIELPDPAEAESEFRAVDYTNGVLVIHIVFTVNARVGNSFKFSMWEGVDREYLPMGSGRVVTDETIAMEALVTLGGRIPEYMKVTDVEILPSSHRIDVGNIKPDWMHDPDNFDIDDNA